MPFTPLHMGPGILIKALLQGSLSSYQGQSIFGAAFVLCTASIVRVQWADWWRFVWANLLASGAEKFIGGQSV